MSEKIRKIILSKTVVYKGKHYPPESIHEWPVDIVDELIEKDAGEPIVDVVAVKDTPVTDEIKSHKSDPRMQELIIFAALDAIKEDQVTSTGAPKVEAMEKILGFDITGKERDLAWETIKKEQGAV